MNRFSLELRRELPWMLGDGPLLPSGETLSKKLATPHSDVLFATHPQGAATTATGSLEAGSVRGRLR
jgi:hypothetical protein